MAIMKTKQEQEPERVEHLCSICHGSFYGYGNNAMQHNGRDTSTYPRSPTWDGFKMKLLTLLAAAAMAAGSLQAQNYNDPNWVPRVAKAAAGIIGTSAATAAGTTGSGDNARATLSENAAGTTAVQRQLLHRL